MTIPTTDFSFGLTTERFLVHVRRASSAAASTRWRAIWRIRPAGRMRRIATLGVIRGTGDNVGLRGKVFVINFAGVLWLMGHAMLAILGGP